VAFIGTKQTKLFHLIHPPDVNQNKIKILRLTCFTKNLEDKPVQTGIGSIGLGMMRLV
jgi:hypothetical protein